MKILFLSDTHGKHRKLENLPEADMLIHAGDVSWAGTENEIGDFVEWLDSLDYKYKIFIAGNHDDCLDGAELDGLPENCHYLCNTGVTIESLKIWGTPFFFSDDLEGRFPERVAQIPTDTDILISHCPPSGILDKSTYGTNMGNEALRRQVDIIKPKYHLFGHIHEAYGISESPRTTYINGSVLDENYELVNQPIIIEIMNEILIVPDVHGRLFWRPALDYPGQIIFLGDYFDPYPKEGIGVDEAYDNFLDIVEFKSANPDRVTLLLGNHELHYFDPAFKYSRKERAYYDEMNEILTGSETAGLFQACKLIGKYLFSHAGVSYGWYKKHFRELMKRGLTIEDQINTYFHDSRMVFDEIGLGRGNRDNFGSPMWADLTEIWYEPKHFDPYIFQVVGHSHDIMMRINRRIACLDTKQLYLLKDDVIDLYTE